MCDETGQMQNSLDTGGSDNMGCGAEVAICDPEKHPDRGFAEPKPCLPF